MHRLPSRTHSTSRLLLHLFALAALAVAGLVPAQAQDASAPALAQNPSDLPNAPDFALNAPPRANSFATSSGVVSSSAAASTMPPASIHDRHIQPGQFAPELTPGDKVVMGLRGALSPFDALGWLASAGYEQLTNSSPNWGTDRGAFGQRLGSAAIRDSSEDILSDSAFAPLLHEDPRYYRLGRGHHPLHRLVYAVTRSFVTRTDSGTTSPNFALLGGNLAGSALTNLYYPRQNRGAGQTLVTFAGSIGGSAIGNSITEFLGGYFFRLTR